MFFNFTSRFAWSLSGRRSSHQGHFAGRLPGSGRNWARAPRPSRCSVACGERRVRKGEGTWTRRGSGASSEDSSCERGQRRLIGPRLTATAQPGAVRPAAQLGPFLRSVRRPAPASASLLASPGPRRGDGFELPGGARPPVHVFYKPIIPALGTGPELQTPVSPGPSRCLQLL